MFYDADFSWSGSTVTHESYVWGEYIFSRLSRNEQFRSSFITRFADLLNTTFLPERSTQMILKARDGIAGEIQEHRARWRNRIINWENNVDDMMAFANQRPAHIRSHMRNNFGIGDEVKVSVDVGGSGRGVIRVNTINISPTTPGVSSISYP
jgi:hypothetical protein